MRLARNRKRAARCAWACSAILLGLDGHLTTGLDSLRRVWDVVNILDDKLNTVPVLAESLDLSTDARQMTIKLRSGIPVPYRA